MSELADRQRLTKRSWAAPGGSHDLFVRFLKIVLPLLIGLLGAYLVLAPLTKGQEISFILDKNKVEVAKERMRVRAARYQGVDDKGRPFAIAARSAVQATSRDPIVDIEGMMAEIRLEDGPARLRAERGRYDLERETVDVIGPILFTAADGYRLETRDVSVNLNDRTLAGDEGVRGWMPLGRFTAERMRVDLSDQRVVLTGGARLHIVQGGLR